jgi:hypothetical protein
VSILDDIETMLEVAVERHWRRQIRELAFDLTNVIGKYSPACYNDPLGSGPPEAYALAAQLVTVMTPQIKDQAKDTVFRKFMATVTDEKYDER